MNGYTFMHSLAHDILSAPVTAVAKHDLPQLKDMYEIDMLVLHKLRVPLSG